MVLGVTPVELGVEVTAGVLVAGAATAAAVTVRRVRRRWRALKASPAARGVMALLDAVRTPGGLRAGVTPARLRLDLWQAVGAATRAVRQASGAGAALGDLPSLTRRLRQAAEDLDRALAMAGGLDVSAPTVVDVHRQVAEAMRASQSIRTAALASAGDAAGARLEQLAADAEQELESVNAGVARARRALSLSAQPPPADAAGRSART